MTGSRAFGWLVFLLVATVVILVACSEDDGAGAFDALADEPGALDDPGCDLGAAPSETDPEVADAPVTFDVQGDVAAMFGNIGADFVHRVCDLIGDNPEVTVVEVVDVPGSSTPGNETLEGGLVLNSSDLATIVASDGQVESGGVDFFMAGTTREVADGGCLGVHSTELDDGDGPIAAADLPRDDPEHEPFLDYYRQIGISEDFYWFTLSAAPPSGIHYLTPQEMERFGVTTGEPPQEPCDLPDDSGQG